MATVKEKQAKRRSEIIESIIPLIAHHNFQEISVTDICRAAGISTGTFYHYFKQKSDLLIGLIWLIDEDIEENIFPLLTNENELENLKIFAHGWAGHISRHGLERSKLISGVNPEVNGFQEKDRPSVRKIHEIFTNAIKKNQISDRYDPDTLTEYFMMMLRSVSTDWSRREGSYDIVKKTDSFTLFFLDACR